MFFYVLFHVFLWNMYVQDLLIINCIALLDDNSCVYSTHINPHTVKRTQCIKFLKCLGMQYRCKYMQIFIDKYCLYNLFYQNFFLDVYSNWVILSIICIVKTCSLDLIRISLTSIVHNYIHRTLHHSYVWNLQLQLRHNVYNCSVKKNI